MALCDAAGSAAAADRRPRAKGKRGRWRRSRFYPPIRPPEAGAPQTWTLPVCFKSGDARFGCELVERAEDSSCKVPQSSFLFPYAGARGYYRSVYPKAVYENIIQHVENSPDTGGADRGSWATSGR